MCHFVHQAIHPFNRKSAMRSLIWWICLAGCLLTGLNANAAVFDVGPEDDWFELLSRRTLNPGDEIVLRQGVYSDGRLLAIRHSGTAGRPIIIRAAAGAEVVFRRPDAKQNTMNLLGTQHLHLRGIEITGGSSGIRIGPDGDRQAGDVVIEAMHIHHVGGPAITCNHVGGIYQRMTFRRNHIHHTTGHAEGFYLGGNDASAILSDSIVESNYIHHLNGPDVSQGDGIEIKQGSYGNRIVGNIIHDTGYPGVTVYGTRGEAINVIENNLIWNTGDHGIQAAADAVVKNNFISGASGCGIYSREHQAAVPDRLRIEANHVVGSGDAAVRIIGSPATSGVTTPVIEVTENQLFASDNQLAFRIENAELSLARGNVGAGPSEGSAAFAADWKTSGSQSQRNAPNLPELIGHPAWEFLDFDDVREHLLAK